MQLASGTGGALANTIATDYFPDPTDARARPRDRAGAARTPASAPTWSTNRSTAARPSTPRRSTSRPRATSWSASRSRAADPRIIYVAIAAPGPHPALARSDDAGATWSTFDLEPSIGARTARIIAVDPVDANVVYLRVIGAGVELLAVSRDGGMTLHDTDHAGGRLAERVRASGERNGAGRGPASRRRRHDRRRGVALGRRRRDLRRLDAGADAAAARARASATARCTSRAATTATAGRWPCPPTRAGRSSRSRATTRSARSRPCVAAICQDLCDEQAGRRIWAPEVCNPSPLDGGSATRARRRRCRAAAEGIVGMRLQQRRRRARTPASPIALLVFVTARRSAARRRRRGTRCSSAR